MLDPIKYPQHQFRSNHQLTKTCIIDHKIGAVPILDSTVHLYIPAWWGLVCQWCSSYTRQFCTLLYTSLVGDGIHVVQFLYQTVLYTSIYQLGGGQYTSGVVPILDSTVHFNIPAWWGLVYQWCSTYTRQYCSFIYTRFVGDGMIVVQYLYQTVLYTYICQV